MRALLSRVSFPRDEVVTRIIIGGAVGSVAAWLVGGFSPEWGLAGASAGAMLAGSALPLRLRLAAFGAAFLAPFFLPVHSLSAGVVFSVSSLVTAAGVLAWSSTGWRARLLTGLGVMLAGQWAVWLTYRLTAQWLGELARVGELMPLTYGLFLGLGAHLGSIRIAPDQVEPRLAAVESALSAWRRARAALSRVTPGRAREALQGVLKEGALQLAQAKEQLAELRLDEQLEATTRDAIAQLTERYNATVDEALRAHLAQTLRIHKDVLEQLDGLKRQRERAEAKVKAHTSWLETAAFSLEVAPRGEEALLELSARLRNLAPA